MATTTRQRRRENRARYETDEEDAGESHSASKPSSTDNSVMKNDDKEVVKEQTTSQDDTESEQPPTTKQQPSQVSLSQGEDEHIRHLDKSGALDHVVGSQSLLTQELVEHDDMRSSNSQQQPIIAAALAADSDAYAAAQSMGLLTQESLPSPQEEYPEEEEQQQHPSSSQSQEAAPLSQLSFLMDAAHAVEQREGEQVREQLLCPEQLPEDEYDLPFDDDEIEEDANLTMVCLIKPTRVPKPTLSYSKRNPGYNNANTRPPNPTLSLAYKHKVDHNKAGATPPTQFMSPQKRRKLEREAEQHSLAKQAAELAAQTAQNPEVAKQLLLSMALVRTNPRSTPTTWPPRGSTIPEGFFWGTYPPLENVLRTYMRQYYELSTTKCQSRDQQAFNNSLVKLVRNKAQHHGWIFNDSFDDKKLRDRIRCFFKTHIQNAKKRLRTMVRNPTKRANAKALVQHLDLIQNYVPKQQTTTAAAAASAAIVPLKDDDDDDDNEDDEDEISSSSLSSEDETTDTSSSRRSHKKKQSSTPRVVDLTKPEHSDMHDAAQQVLGFAKISQDKVSATI